MTVNPIVFLINPSSGGGQGEKIYRKFNCLNSANIEAIILKSSRESLESIVPNLSRFETVVICGGDGTISSLLPYLAPFCTRMGIVPIGTGNDLARELGIPLDLAQWSTAEILNYFTSSRSKLVNIFKITDGTDTHYFTNYLSMGYDARVIKLFSVVRAGLISIGINFRVVNLFTYVICGILAIPYRFKAPIKVSSDRANILLDGRSVVFTGLKHYLGGVELSTSTQLAEDEKLYCYNFRRITDYLWAILTYRSSLPVALYGKSFSISFPQDTALQIDGEPFVSRTGSISIQLHQSIPVVSAT